MSKEEKLAVQGDETEVPDQDLERLRAEIEKPERELELQSGEKGLTDEEEVVVSTGGRRGGSRGMAGWMPGDRDQVTGGLPGIGGDF